MSDDGDCCYPIRDKSTPPPDAQAMTDYEEIVRLRHVVCDQMQAIEQLEARLTASEAKRKWTTARPTVAGFYWFRKGGKKRVVELEFESDGETLAAEGWRLIANYWNGEFQGPLTPGEE